VRDGDTVNQIFCPQCAKEIKPIEYGNGWLWVCCGKVVHNASRLDESTRDESTRRDAERDMKTDDH
jgi:predicted amidophosphoribosyltransferase